MKVHHFVGLKCRASQNLRVGETWTSPKKLSTVDVLTLVWITFSSFIGDSQKSIQDQSVSEDQPDTWPKIGEQSLWVQKKNEHRGGGGCVDTRSHLARL